MEKQANRMNWAVGFLFIGAAIVFGFSSVISGDVLTGIKDSILGNSESYIEFKVTRTYGTVEITNKWTTPISYSIDNGKRIEVVDSEIIPDSKLKNGSVIKIYESEKNKTFRSFRNEYSRILDSGEVEVTKMPSMDKFTTDEDGKHAGDYFFNYFLPRSTTRLPDGSFDTRKIETAGYSYFGYGIGANLKELPKGSFNTDKLTKVGDFAFQGFNYRGTLTKLPDGSFNTSNLKKIGTGFLTSFNANGDLKTLPKGSFSLINLDAINNADYEFTLFMGDFNLNGDLETDTTSPNRIIIHNITKAQINLGNATVLPGQTFDGYKTN